MPTKRLTADEIAGGLDPYVDYCLNCIKDDNNNNLLQSSDYDALLKLCSPDITLEIVENSISQEHKKKFNVLIDLFRDPKKNFYQTQPHVNESHNLILQHILRRILLRRLLQTMLDEKKKFEDDKITCTNFSLNEFNVRELLSALLTEEKNLKSAKYRTKIDCGAFLGEMIVLGSMLIMGVLLINTLRHKYPPGEAPSPILRVSPIFLILIWYILRLPGVLRDIKKTLPQTIQLELQALSSSTEFEKKINALYDELTDVPSKRLTSACHGCFL